MDPGVLDSFTLTIDWGEGDPETITLPARTTTFAVYHPYGDDDPTLTPSDLYAVSVSVEDSDGGVGNTANEATTVSNVAPTIVGLGTTTTTVGEGDEVTVAGQVGDLGTRDTHSVLITWGDRTMPTTVPVDPITRTFTASHRYVDNAPAGYTVTATATDDDQGESAPATLLINVLNAPPVVGDILVTDDVLNISTGVTTSVPFTDAGIADTHTAVWDWGDGTTSPGTVTESGGSGTVTGAHTYTQAGVYTVTVTVTDNDGASGASLYQFLVIYDPSAGFITGGGTLVSPPGAYPADPMVVGTPNFGFNAMYKRSSEVPEGNTLFQFAEANLKFESTSYDWMVVAGDRAYLQGSGTINGSGAYAFLITFIDGEINGGQSDTFRIMIWDPATGDIIYDNQPGAAITAVPHTPLDGGTVEIHTNGSSMITSQSPPSGTRAPAVLAHEDLQPILGEAIRRWIDRGLDPKVAQALSRIDIGITNLSGSQLGLTIEEAGIIWLDDDASGWGWFVDPTPREDSEFTTPGDQGEQGRMDLLTVIVHEFGHILGHGHDHVRDQALMSPALPAGTRLHPDHQGPVDRLLPNSDSEGMAELPVQVGCSGSEVSTVPSDASLGSASNRLTLEGIPVAGLEGLIVAARLSPGPEGDASEPPAYLGAGRKTDPRVSAHGHSEAVSSPLDDERLSSDPSLVVDVVFNRLGEFVAGRYQSEGTRVPLFDDKNTYVPVSIVEPTPSHQYSRVGSTEMDSEGILTRRLISGEDILMALTRVDLLRWVLLEDLED